MDDADLLREFRNGNQDAIRELVQRHSKPLTIMILKMVRDLETAKDISQTVFLKAFEGLPRFMSASSFKTWLYRIAVNAVRDHVRRRKPMADPEALEMLVDPDDPVSERLDRARSLQKLRAAVADLPERQRLTLQLRVYEGLDYQEIARILGGTAGAARGNFFQATKTLREKLGGNHGPG